jgi:hypothetical protein
MLIGDRENSGEHELSASSRKMSTMMHEKETPSFEWRGGHANICAATPQWRALPPCPSVEREPHPPSPDAAAAPPHLKRQGIEKLVDNFKRFSGTPDV